MTVKIKICGVRETATLHACAAVGVDFVGINVTTWSRRRVDHRTAGRLVKAIPPGAGLEAVLVFCDQAIEDVRAFAEPLQVRYVQLHGEETPEMCAALSDHFSVIKALPGATANDATLLAAYADHCAALLFDGVDAGSGTRWDDEQVAHLALDIPIFVAGGLTPENVGDVVERVQPWAVDVASGIETDGVPDPRLIEAFVAAAHGSRPH